MTRASDAGGQDGDRFTTSALLLFSTTLNKDRADLSEATATLQVNTQLHDHPEGKEIDISIIICTKYILNYLFNSIDMYNMHIYCIVCTFIVSYAYLLYPMHIYCILCTFIVSYAHLLYRMHIYCIVCTFIVCARQPFHAGH